MHCDKEDQKHYLSNSRHTRCQKANFLVSRHVRNACECSEWQKERERREREKGRRGWKLVINKAENV